jgi:hypothetical protein
MSGVVYKLNGRVVTREEFAAAGDDARFSAMLAARRGPALRTDTAHLGKLHDRSFGENDPTARLYLNAARAAGVNPKGKYYCPSLAEYSGDPEAWIETKGDAIRVAKKKGMRLRISGEVVYDPPQTSDPVDPGAPYEVADDIVHEAVCEKIAADPQIAEAPGAVEELHEQVKSTMESELN